MLLYLKDQTLGVYLIERLLTNFCQVYLVTQRSTYWADKLRHLSQNKNIKLISFERSLKLDAAYVIFSFDFIQSKNDVGFLSAIKIRSETNNSVFLGIYPYAIETDFEIEAFKLAQDTFSDLSNIKNVYLGDVYGPRMTFGSNTFSGIFYKALVKKQAYLNSDRIFYISFAPAVTKALVRTLFSFGSKEGALYFTSQVSEKDLVKILRTYVPEISLLQDKPKDTRVLLKISKRFLIETDFLDSFKKTFLWFSMKSPEFVFTKKVRQKPITIKFPKMNPNFNPKLFYQALIIIFVASIVTPLFLLASALGVFAIGGYFTHLSNMGGARSSFALSRALSDLTEQSLFVLGKTPVVGKYYGSTYSASSFLSQLSEISLEGLDLIEKSEAVGLNILAKNQYDLDETFLNIRVTLDSLYKKVSFLESDVDSLGMYSWPVKKTFEKYRIRELRENLLFLKDLSAEMPSLLGGEEPTTYMVLFQNSAELRPTGGFIGSFGLLTFDKGILASLEIFDVYDADGQLKGYVAPPEPIVTYLGESSWFLRDANWDPDFPSSASKIEWFLGKELGKSVDGVIGVDLFVIRSIVSALGEVTVVDYSVTVNEDNFYEITQAQAESKFFPGSTNKKSFLTALTRSLIQELTDRRNLNYSLLAKNIYTNLNETHLQVSLNNKKARSLFSEHGFDGGVSTGNCIVANCYLDFLGLVEANLGVNKVNPFVKRQMGLTVLIDGGLIQRDLVVNYKNESSKPKGDSYKNYLRLLMSLESEISAVELNGQRVEFTQEDTNGRKEVGVFLNIAPGDEAAVRFTWQEKVQTTTLDEYAINWRKQAGTDKDPVSVKIKAGEIKSFDESGAFLTPEGTYVYNTLLSRDLVVRLRIEK